MARALQVILLVILPVAVFAAMVAADRMFGAPGRGYNYVVRVELPATNGEVGLPAIEGPQDASRPLVVIDPGHGGFDPGAGSGGLREKELTLFLANALRRQLLDGGGIRVAMTRSDDRYLFLEDRSGIARRLKADLFISIHADSAGNPEANGASIYTLSESGSSEIASRMAERENGANTVNGVRLAAANDTVNAILVDLSQRETQAHSGDLARLIVREGQGRIRFREGPLQSAAFVVLKSPDVPSILFEAGYISNDGDAAWLRSSAGSLAFAGATARAIRVHFARQSLR